MKTRTRLATVLVACLCPLFIACLWDNDTIQMERRKFPNALELITGKFLRHSDAYYQWRIEDRTPKLAANPTAELFDDLAVAHEKLGNHDQAIELMLQKQLAFPDLYETHANLGTFYIHQGSHEKGVEEISQSVSPLTSTQISDDPEVLSLPLDREGTPGHFSVYGFAKHLDVSAKEESGKKAVKGILGMMRFGNYDSPILLEALGDLLQTTDESNMIAARAYLKASYHTKDKNSVEAYREKAAACIKRQEQGELTLSKLEEDFQVEIKEAQEWFAHIIQDEKSWVSQGLNLDQEFGKKYYEDPIISNAPNVFNRIDLRPLAMIAIVIALLLIWFNQRQRNRARQLA